MSMNIAVSPKSPSPSGKSPKAPAAADPPPASPSTADLTDAEIAKLPQWKRALILQERQAKEREEREKEERVRKIEEIKKRHASVSHTKSGLLPKSKPDVSSPPPKPVSLSGSDGNLPSVSENPKKNSEIEAPKTEVVFPAPVIVEAKTPVPAVGRIAGGLTRTASLGNPSQLSKSVSSAIAKARAANATKNTPPAQGKPEAEAPAGPVQGQDKADGKEKRLSFVQEKMSTLVRATDDIGVGPVKNPTDKKPVENQKLKEMEDEIALMRQYKEELENKHNKTVITFEEEITIQKTKQEEMQEALANLRKMKDELELQHLAYQKRLEQRVQEEIKQKQEVEAELDRTRSRLVAELDTIQATKQNLQHQIDELKLESQKKAHIESELEDLLKIKEKLDSEVMGLKEEAGRKAVIEGELERMRKVKESLDLEMEKMQEERRKKKELEEEFEKVKNNRVLLEQEIGQLRSEKARREEIERELDNIKKSKLDLENEINNLKGESEKRKELEKSLDLLQQSRDSYQLEMDKMITNTASAGAERELKLEQLLNTAKVDSHNLQTEIEKLRKESENKRKIEEELETVKIESQKLLNEVESLHKEAEKQKVIKEELQRVQSQKEKLTLEMAVLKSEHERRLKLEAELEELKEIKDRFATEISQLKNQQQNILQKSEQEEKKAQEVVEKVTQKAKEENEVLSLTVKKQQEKIEKLKEKNRKLSTHTKVPPLLKMTLNKKEKEEFYLRVIPSNFKSAFVTGADTHPAALELIKTLRGNDLDVVAFVKPTSPVSILHSLGVVTARGSLDNIHDMAASMQGCEVIFHCAIQSVGTGYQDFAINVSGTTNVLAAGKMAKCRRIVLLSTAEVALGNAPVDNNIAIDENLKIQMERCEGMFGKSMVLAEQTLLKGKIESYTDDVLDEGDYNMEVVIIRPPWIWSKSDYRVTKIIEAIRANKFTWVNGGTYLYSSCYVSNVVEALILAGDNGEDGEIYYVSDTYPMPFKEFVTRISATQNIDCSHIPTVSNWYGSAVSWFQRTTGASQYAEISLNPNLTTSLVVSDKKARSKLGYNSLVSFDRALDLIREEFIVDLKTPRSELVHKKH